VFNVLIAKNQQWLLPVPTLVGAAVNVALNLVLIPRYGAAGAAWATLVSYTVAWTAVLFCFRETRSLIWQGMRFAGPITGFALFAVAGASFVSTHDIVRILTACTLFGLNLWLFGFIKRSDVTDALSVVRSSLGNI
jgi:O-antigen/teichoic acid export membrane protein